MPGTLLSAGLTALAAGLSAGLSAGLAAHLLGIQILPSAVTRLLPGRRRQLPRTAGRRSVHGPRR